MKPSEWLESLRNIDFNDLDTSNIGSWPAAVKAMAGALLMVLVAWWLWRVLPTSRTALRGR